MVIFGYELSPFCSRARQMLEDEGVPREPDQGSECVTNSYVSSSETSSRAASRSATEASACPSVLQLLANVASATRVRLGDPYGSRLIPKYTKDRQWKSVACREMWSQMDPRLRKALDKGDLPALEPGVASRARRRGRP